MFAVYLLANLHGIEGSACEAWHETMLSIRPSIMRAITGTLGGENLAIKG